MYLNCHTYYSLRFGTFSETELLDLARDCGVTTLALTDINNTSACLNFIRKSKDYGIRPIVGIDFRNGADQQFVGLARNNEGFKELNDFLSYHSHHHIPIPTEPPLFPNSYLIYPYEKVVRRGKQRFRENEFIGISIENLKRLPFSVYREFTDRLVMQQPVTFRNKKDFNAHRLLRAIANNSLLSKLQKTEEGNLSEKMLPETELLERYADFPHIIKNTRALIADCHIDFHFSKNRFSQNLQVYGESKEKDFEMLVTLCNENLPKRYPHPDGTVRARLEKELHIIRDMDFVSYFLINHDIVTHAKSKGFFHVGRGSGANSIIAYIIGITDVDPIELDLYFERFINPYRSSPPDFDIDFDWRDREAMTDYIFERFPHVALLATYNTFGYRAVTRELGKVFGLPKEKIDQLSDGRYDSSLLDETSTLILKYGKLIAGFPNHLGIHSAGILILGKPVHYYSATDLPPKGFPTVQFDMIIAEDVGIFKFDILGQRGLAKIKDAITIIKKNRPGRPPINIHQVDRFKNDVRINAMLTRGTAIGAYYIESPAMRGLMKKLKVNNYLGLVAASSVVRPGVSSSGMKHEYVRRHRDPERRKEAHPTLMEIMPETYGIMVYQEDVLKVANLFAGLDLGEADILRRGMSGKFRSREEFLVVEKKFISNCREKGYPDKLIFEVWDQIAGFAGFAFAKGHSASYAVESYQSLYLKCYFPLEFMVAVLNNGGGFYSTGHYVHEARMNGGTIHPPCINRSENVCNIKGRDIFLGFGPIKDLESAVVERLLAERLANGPFVSLDDFMDRVPTGIEQLTILVRVGAFRFTGMSKAALLWRAIFKIKMGGTRPIAPKLFISDPIEIKLPELRSGWLEDAYDQMELLGFPLCNYFDLMDEELQSDLKAADMADHVGGPILIYGLLVHTKFKKTKHGKKVRLSTFIDLDGHYFDMVHFPDVVDKYPIHGIGIYSCLGKVTEEFGHCSIQAIRTRKIAVKPDPRISVDSQYKNMSVPGLKDRNW